jgi:3-deoxy-7-phosphoheptulonate synthase
MIVVLKRNPDPNQLEYLTNWLKSMSVDVHTSVGSMHTILGLVGDTTSIDINLLKALEIVEDVKRVQEPYKNANRKFHPDDTIIDIGGVKIGGGHRAIIAGPCSVESEEQLCTIAKAVKAAGANMLRGGAFKPRTSPYSFQGLRQSGIELLIKAKQESGLPIVTEIMDINHLSQFDDVDIIQVGARNMQNYELLKELGKTNKPILLKRGFASTLEELLMSAEYIMAGGNEQVILCERGIRTFETATRNTMDISAIPMLRKMTHLPIVADPSHATGISSIVAPMAMAAIVAGADGVIIEVHNDPCHALCDGAQSLTPLSFAQLSRTLHDLMPLAWRG